MMNHGAKRWGGGGIGLWPALLHLLFFSLVLLWSTMVAAQTVPQVSTKFVRDFARISFEWPADVKLKANAQGNKLTLQFDRDIAVDPVPILKNLAPYVTSVQQSTDNRTLVLEMNRPYKIRSFVSDNVNGVDILKLNITPQQSARELATIKKPPANRPKPKAPPAKPAEKKKPQAPKAAAVAPKETPATAQFEAPPAPQKKPSVPAAQEVAKAVPKQEEVPAKSPETSAMPQEEIAAAAPVAGVVARPVEETAQQAAAPSAEVAAPTDATPRETAGEITQLPSEKDDQLIFSFPFSQRTAMAAFRRGDRVMLVFNRPEAFSLRAMKSNPALQQVQWMSPPTEGSSALSFITEKQGLRAEKAPGSYHWKIVLDDAPQLPEEIIPTRPQAEPPLRPHVFMPVLQSADPIPFKDPLVGDVLSVVPLYSSSTGIFPQRHFVEFSVLRSAQGVVIKKHLDDLLVARLRNGLKVTLPGVGITLSDDLPQVDVPSLRDSIPAHGDILYPYAEWKIPSSYMSFADYEQQLLSRTALKEGETQADARLRLAQLYMAYDRPHEALSLLNLIRRFQPDYYDRMKLTAMRGAANFIAYRFNDADQDFADPALDDNPEIALWRDTLDILFTQTGKGNYMDYVENYTRHYPPKFQKKLALITADYWVQKGRFNRALEIFNQIHGQDQLLLDEMRPHVQLIIAKIAAESNKTEEALALWQKLMESDAERFIKVRASYDQTRHLLAEGKIDMQEAINRLDPLRIQWRGDQFELNLLNLLGKLYEATNQYREALRAWREIINAFPNNPTNIELRAHMGDIFARLFNEGDADELEPLEALALYYEFRDLTPVGRPGDEMIRNLADRLVKVDLLDRAAALLEHQVRFRTSGEERSRIGARLALLHLLNRKPDKALETLELTGFGQNPESLRETRTLLTARALTDLGTPDKALGLLENYDSPAAQLLKLETHWGKKDWESVTATAENILSQREDPTQPLDETESDVLLKLALSYIFRNEDEQVQYLRDYFLPLMKDNTDEPLFSFVTQDTPVDPKNLAELTRHMSSIEGFLESYRARMRQNGISGALEE